MAHTSPPDRVRSGLRSRIASCRAALRKQRGRAPSGRFPIEPLEERKLLAIVNGAFESGITGWSAVPSALTSVVSVYSAQPSSSPATYSPVDGSRFALVTAATNNSYMQLSQAFSAVPGDRISGWAFFDAADTLPRNDDGYVAIKASTGPLIAQPFSESVGNLGNNGGQTPWTYWEYVFSAAGTYRIEAGVRNVGSGTSPSRLGLDAVVLEGGFPIPPANNAPTADAGGPYTIAEGDALTLSGSGADPDGNPLRYTWDLNRDNQFNEGFASNVTIPWADLVRYGINNGPASYDVKLRVTDSWGASTISTTTVTVNNTAPYDLQIDGPDHLKAGQFASYFGSAQDYGADGLEYSWSVTKDGESVYETGGTRFITFQPTEPGTYEVTLNVGDGEAVSHETLVVEVAPNHAPTITELEVGPASIFEGASGWVRGTFEDPDPFDTHTIQIWFGDGNYNGIGPGMPYNVIAAQVHDGHTYFLASGSWEENEGLAQALGGHLATIGSQEEQDWAWNTFSPMIDSQIIHIGLSDREQEGQFVWASGEPVGYTNWSIGEPNNYNGVEDFVAMWGGFGGKWNDFAPNFGAYALIEVDSPDAIPGPNDFFGWGTYFDDGTYSPTGDNTFDVTVIVTDDPGLSDVGYGRIEVLNVPPKVEAMPGLTLDEGTVLSGVGMFYDPGYYDPLTAAVDYGDGSGVQEVPVDNWQITTNRNFYLDHAYADDGTYTLTLTVTDDEFGSTTTTWDVFVRNVAPSASNLSVVPDAVDEGGEVRLTGTLYEINPADAVSAEIDWGDGHVTTRQFEAGAEMALDETHVYADDPSGTGPDTYDVVVTVRDDDGGTWSSAAPVEGAVQWASGDGANGHWYKVIDAPPGGVHAAEAKAAALGGRLVTILSAEEQQFLNDTFLVGDGLDEAYWIGVSDAEEEGVWRWNTGELSYHRWAHHVWGYQTDEYGYYLYDEFGNLIPAPYPGPTPADEPATYSNWYATSGEPNDSWPGEDYAAMNWQYMLRDAYPDAVPGQWNDEDEFEAAVRRAIVEFDGPFGPMKVTVNNVAPAVAVSGPSLGVPGQPRRFTASIDDPGTADTHAVTWQVLSGVEVVASGSGTSFEFTPVGTGTYTVEFTAVDDDGGVGAGSAGLTVERFNLQPDPADATKTVLAVGGTAGVDNFVVKPRSGGSVEVVLNDVVLGRFSPSGGVHVFGGAGNDHTIVTGALPVPVTFFGGDGDDILRSNNAHDILIGGPGDDRVFGTAQNA